jgi:hypothetical protein
VNKRNVEVLYRLVHEHEAGYDPGGELVCRRCHQIAEWLASRGVLVPSALTDDDMAALVYAGEQFRQWNDMFVPTLERIAKGEQ